MAPPIKKATLHKLFIVDPQGEYRGEIPLNESCLVEWEEILEALSGRSLGDGQSIFLGEWKVTAISGERMGLVAISTGSLGSEELAWARSALVAAEATLVGELKPAPPKLDAAEYDEEPPETPVRPAPAPSPSLDAREKLLQKREEAARKMEENARVSMAEFLRSSEAQIADLKAQLAGAREERERDRKAMAALEAERDRARELSHRPAPAPNPSTSASLAEFRRSSEAQIADLRTQLTAAREERDRDRRALAALEAERGRTRDLTHRPPEFRGSSVAEMEELKAQLAAAREEKEWDRRALAAKEAERDHAREFPHRPAPAPKSPQWPSSDSELQDIRQEIEREKMLLQRRAIEFLEREETLRERETKVEDEARLMRTAREEIDRRRGEVQVAKHAEDSFDPDAARRDIDQRVMALQQRANDLLAREEQLKKRAEEMKALLDGTM